MKCPHCLENFHEQMTRQRVGDDLRLEVGDGLTCVYTKDQYVVESTNCPACNRLVLVLLRADQSGNWESRQMFFPKTIARSPLSPDVPKEFAEDYSEACVALADSAKASAALSRRCLQHVLREVAKVKHSDLANEIQQVLDARSLPGYIANPLDAVRAIGNFAAHPIKSQRSGEVLPVEPGEAELNLDVLEALFDFYFVQPAQMKKKIDALNAKLTEAGKPQAKTAP